MDWSLGTTAFFWGSFSALSLLLGAAIGLWLKPTRKINAVFMAFGAGAMLTMIAETMLPEAFEQGGSVIGLSTLGGFLSALVIKIVAA